MRVYSVNLTGEREWYATQHYKEIEGGEFLNTGKHHNVTNDIRPYLVKAQRDMCVIIKEQLEIMRNTLPDGPNYEEVMDVISDEIAGRTEP